MIFVGQLLANFTIDHSKQFEDKYELFRNNINTLLYSEKDNLIKVYVRKLITFLLKSVFKQ